MADINIEIKLEYDEKERAIIIITKGLKSILLKAGVPDEYGTVYTEEALKKMIDKFNKQKGKDK